MSHRKPGILRQRLADPEVRDRVFRILSLALLLVAVGACVVLLLAFVLGLEVILVVFAGVLSMAASLYGLVRLWPREAEPEPKLGEAVKRALEPPKPEPLSPEEYRRQRERAQKLIRDKAAPALAKAIRGILRQDAASQQRRQSRGRRGR